jgi:hypothetical protein
LARHIDLPKLPEMLSLSVAVLVAPELIGSELVLGHRRHDLATIAGASVAVKGTGPVDQGHDG